MKLKDMTIGQINAAADGFAESVVPHFRNSARSAFVKGAVWAYNYLLTQGHVTMDMVNQQRPERRPDAI